MKSKTASKPDPPLPPASDHDPAPAGRLVLPARSAPVFKHILVAIDFSEAATKALDYATTLAVKFHGELILLHVVEPTVYSPNTLRSSPPLEEADQNLLAASRDRLRKLKQKTEAQGLSTEILVRMGRAQSDISDTARAMGADLIVMGGHNSSRQSLLGGTAERVLSHAGCPVLIVPHPNP